MKDKFCVIIFIVGVVVVIGCVIASSVFAIQNPDMTEIRRFIEFPQPTIVLCIDCIILNLTRWWWGE